MAAHGRGIYEAENYTQPAATNSITIEVQDQSYGRAGIEYYGFAVAESRSAPGAGSLVFGTRPDGYPKVKAILWSGNNTGGEIYVQVDADLTDQAQIVMNAFGNSYTLSRTNQFNPVAAVGGETQAVYYASHLGLPSDLNHPQETITFENTGNTGVPVNIGTAQVTEIRWDEMFGGRQVVSGHTLPETDEFSYGDQFALHRAQGTNGRGLYTMRQQGSVSVLPAMGATITKGSTGRRRRVFYRSYQRAH